MGIESIYKGLEKTKEQLLRYCHHKDCCSLRQCPSRHPKCKEKLGLDTAIAWCAAQHITSLLKEERMNDHIALSYLTCINTLLDVVALHSKEFPLLYRLLDDTSWWERWLRQEIFFHNC